MPDLTDKPDHYNRGDIECIDALRAMLGPDEFRGFLRGTAARYLWRMGSKDATAQEAEKALFYARELVLLEGGDPTTGERRIAAYKDKPSS